MKAKSLICVLAILLIGMAGCDVPWRSLAAIAGASGTGDYAAVTAFVVNSLGDHDDDNGSDAWYCWPVCSWFD